MRKLPLLALATALGGAACGDNIDSVTTPDAPAASPDAAALDTTAVLKAKVKTIVFIYAENRGFDNVYGLFPHANGIPGKNPDATGAYIPQVDRDASSTLLPKLPQSWGGVTAAGFTPAITQATSDNLPNAPYALEDVYAGLSQQTITRDLYHRFFENQMQIDGGTNDKFAGYADSGGLVMGYYKTHGALWDLAGQYVLADNFFQGAFGGSFLNHHYLICGCAPEYPNADTAAAAPTIAAIDKDAAGHFTRLTPGATSPASAIDGAPTFQLSGNIAPKNYFGDGTFRAVNTMQPPYQPSGNAPAATDTTKLFADPARPTTLPPQTQPTIGDQLYAKGVAWKWYGGAFTSTLDHATGDRAFPSTTVPGSAPNYQFHHQPFNYYKAFDPATAAAARAAHLKDYTDLMADAAAGTLPPVAFYKPEGDLNQHAGYASLAAGDQHLADVVAALKASPQFANMVIVITYDENGGWWDHVAPPRADLLGPGTRVPALIIAPVAKAGTVDHTQYDTASILRLIARRFDLAPLPGVAARDAALVANGGTAMGDLTNALDLAP